jgi:hypothetical protein
MLRYFNDQVGIGRLSAVRTSLWNTNGIQNRRELTGFKSQVNDWSLYLDDFSCRHSGGQFLSANACGIYYLRRRRNY